MEITSHSFLMSTNCRFLFLAISQSLFNLVFSPFLLIIPFLFYKFTEKGWAFLNFFENTKRDSVLIHFHFFIINLDHSLSIMMLYRIPVLYAILHFFFWETKNIWRNVPITDWTFVSPQNWYVETLPFSVMFLRDRAFEK